ncbi:hypothetical protein [Streptomyces sp. NPDC055134]
MTVEISPESHHPVDNTEEMLPVLGNDVALDNALDLPGDRKQRIARDAALVAELRRTNFAGPRYEVFENGLARDALPQLKGMLRTGTLITLAKQKWRTNGVKLYVAEGNQHLLRESLEQRDILAVNILMATLSSFRRNALVKGDGTPGMRGSAGQAAC